MARHGRRDTRQKSSHRRSPKSTPAAFWSRAIAVGRVRHAAEQEAVKRRPAVEKERAAAAEALHAFAIAVRTRLPDCAWQELDALPRTESDLLAWAERYHINARTPAPGLISYVAVYANGGLQKALAEGWDYATQDPVWTASRRPQLLDHCDWLVRYQQGESCEKIARNVSRVRHAVEKAIKHVAHRIGLTLRASIRNRSR